MTPEEYIQAELAQGRLTTAHLKQLVREFQAQAGLEVDGKPGPQTRAELEKRLAPTPSHALQVDGHGWLIGANITMMPIHGSWFGGALAGDGTPKGVVCHVSATNPGTALNMAKRRMRTFGTDPDDRLASWHASIEADGSVVQMIPFLSKAWHAGSPTALPIPGIGSANSHTIGLELIGWEKGPFPEAQVEGYARVLKAIVTAYKIPRELAMITHASIDPTRRSDPGEDWMKNHAEKVLDLVYGDKP